MKHADRILRNADDTRRARVYKHASGEGYDYDLFKRNVLNGGWWVESAVLTTEGESPQPLKRLLDWLENENIYTPVEGVETVTEGWPEARPPKPTKDAAVAIRRGQIWRLGRRQLVVDSVSPHWNRERLGEPDLRQIGCHFIQSSGREVGTMIVGRRSARQSYAEPRFREKFRFVRDMNDPAEEE
jgi:hypothetical protein